MGYRSIQNLYAENEVLTLFKEVYYLEKIHGTSTNICWFETNTSYFSGGVKQARFENLFDDKKMKRLFEKLGHPHVEVYGEAYGASVLKQSHRYGKELRFVAFEVKIGDAWLAVPDALDVCKQLELPFVSYVKGPATVKFAHMQRDLPSIQAVLNGVEGNQIREGVVIRPMIELTKNNGERICAKHKHPKFEEIATPRKVASPEQLKVLSDAVEVADEWVTPNRLIHVLDKLQPQETLLGVRDTGTVIKAMIADVKKESTKEVVWSNSVSKAIGKRARILFHDSINKLKEDSDAEEVCEAEAAQG